MPGAEKFELHFQGGRHEAVERGLSLPEVALISGHRDHCATPTVGHEKTTMTYGLYSGGVSLAVKRGALEMLAY